MSQHSAREPGLARALFAVLTADRSHPTKLDPTTLAADLKASRPGRTLGVIAVVTAVAIGAVLGLEAALHPWARSLIGAPTLVGEWQGELTTPAGRVRVVRFVVRPLNAQTCKNCPLINATVTLCDERGAANDFEAWGDPQNWRGTVFRLTTGKANDRPVDLKLGVLDGEWHADTLRLTTTLRVDASQAFAPDTLTPVTILMRRGGERDFASACDRLKSFPKA